MIRLRVLGTPDLHTDEGVEARAVIERPECVALLTYLAAAEPPGLHRREVLAHILWPHLDEPRAQSALDEAIRFLRGHLGAEIITGRGVDEIGIDRDRLWCDVRAFREALAAARPMDALPLYRGELLDGFEAPESPELGRWLHEERVTLHRMAAAASAAVADTKQGNGGLTRQAGEPRGQVEDLGRSSPRAAVALASARPTLVHSPLASSPPPIDLTGSGGDNLEPGDTLSNRRYVIERMIGAGGMASVYLARDMKHERRVAIKLLRFELAETVGARRLLREIRIAAALQHPHIVPLFDSGETAGRVFYVMPYVDGETLRSRMDRGPRMATGEAMRVMREIGDALAHAHQHGIVHRDIKPENVLLTADPSTADYHALVADFGLAKALDASRGGRDRDVSVTDSGIGVGTPGYMAPEQATGGDVDGRADVYAWGVVAYELLGGSHPFVGRTAQQLIAAHISEAPELLTDRQPGVPSAVSGLVMRCLEKEPRARLASGSELVVAIDRAMTAPATSIAPPDAPAPATTPPPRTEPSPHVGPRRAISRRVWLSAATLAAMGAVWLGAKSLRGTPGTNRFAERDWILVSDFDGAPGDSGLAEAVRELTTAELNQSSFMSTLPRLQLNATMRLAGIPDTTHVGPDLARELAFRSAVRAVLVGSVRHIGKAEYSIVLHVVAADDGAEISSRAGAATEQTLIPTVQRLAGQVRADLGERRSAIEAALPLDHIATPSFEAYRKYADGLRLQVRGDGRGSNRLLRDALALDTAFASAWFTMGWNYLNDRMLDSARWAFGQALARRDRLSEPQRYRLEADAAYTLDYDLPAAIRAYDLYLARWPRSWAVHNNRGNYLLALGRYEDALESYERAVSAHPFGPRQAQIQVGNQAATLIALGRLDEAERVSADLTGPFKVYSRLMLDVARERWRDADSLGAAAATAPSSPGWLKVQSAAVSAASRAARGAVTSADAALAQAAAAGPSPDVVRWFQRARLLLAVVSRREIPRPPATLASDTTAAGRVSSGLWAAVANDSAAARAALNALATVSSADRRRLGNGPALLEAWLEARANRWHRAADLIGSQALTGEHDTALLDRVGSLSLRWLAAEAYAASGRPDSATAMLELAIRPQRMPGNEFALRGLVVPFAHRRLAQWYTEAGRPNDAVRHWEAFLESFTEPDADMAPLVLEAHRALRRLKSA